MSSGSSRVKYWVGGLLSLALLTAPALAQEEKPKAFQEPGIVYKADTRPYIPWLFAVLAIGAVLIVAFKNPHRTHLD